MFARGQGTWEKSKICQQQKLHRNLEEGICKDKKNP